MSPKEESAKPDVVGLDPWGLRRIERLLVGLDGVTSLKVVADGRGSIDEIHVLSDARLGAKQIVRNIESALLAEFGLQVDHRKISVARFRGQDQDLPAVTEAAQAKAVEAARSSRLLLGSLDIQRKAGEQVTCRVVLQNGDGEYVGEAEGPDSSRSRLEVSATAVLRALHKATGEKAALNLDGVSQVELSGRNLVVAVVNASTHRKAICLTGISRITDSPEEAAVRACLHATNRWVADF